MTDNKKIILGKVPEEPKWILDASKDWILPAKIDDESWGTKLEEAKGSGWKKI